MIIPNMPAAEAIVRLKEGNQRFVSNVRSIESLISQMQRPLLADGQQPFAILLGCSDSRVPAEAVFDQGLGDLFVIRVAGNIVAPSQIGSVEFAVEQFGTQLVVVLGHTWCGVVQAAVDAAKSRTSTGSHNLMSIVDRVRPSVVPLLATNLVQDPEALMRAVVRANVQMSVNQLRHGSVLIEKLVSSGELVVIGAEYELATGNVVFFEDDQ